MDDSCHEQKMLEQTSTGLWLLVCVILVIASPFLVAAWVLAWLVEVLEEAPWYVFRVLSAPFLAAAWVIGGLAKIVGVKT